MNPFKKFIHSGGQNLLTAGHGGKIICLLLVLTFLLPFSPLLTVSAQAIPVKPVAIPASYYPNPPVLAQVIQSASKYYGSIDWIRERRVESILTVPGYSVLSGPKSAVDEFIENNPEITMDHYDFSVDTARLPKEPGAKAMALLSVGPDQSAQMIETGSGLTVEKLYLTSGSGNSIFGSACYAVPILKPENILLPKGQAYPWTGNRVHVVFLDGGAKTRTYTYTNFANQPVTLTFTKSFLSNLTLNVTQSQLSHNVVSVVSHYSSSHGPFVFSVAANIAPGATYTLTQVLNDDCVGNSYDLYKGLDDAIRQAMDKPTISTIINLSLVFGVEVAPDEVQLLKDLVALAVKHKIFIVAAAGNQSLLNSPVKPGYPCVLEGVLCVGASNHLQMPGFYSNQPAEIYIGVENDTNATTLVGLVNSCTPLNYAACVVVSAPGTTQTSQFFWSQGTSLKAPTIAAAVALLFEAGASYEQIWARLYTFTGQVVTVDQLLGSFTKISPLNSTFTPSASAFSQTLRWGTSLGAIAYEYCYDTTNDGACSGSWISAGTNTYATLSGLSANTTYYWQVRAIQKGWIIYANNNQPNSSGVWWKFTTLIIASPGPFAKSSLTNSATGVAITPVLKWGVSSGVTQYQYCYDTTNDNACSGAWLNAGTNPSITLTGLSNNTTYYWQVRAINPGGTTYANGGTWWKFTTIMAPPGAFAKSSPANAVTGVAITPVLKWGLSSGAAQYQYCYDTTNDNACSGAWINAGTNTSVTLTGLSNNTTYYWQVRAINPGGTTYANGGVWWKFTTIVAPPGAFAKSSPANAATGVAISPLSTTAGVAVAPVLKWGSSSGVARYEYCYSTTNNTCSGAWLNAGTNTSVTLTGLRNNTTYYWQVRAVNPGGTTYANADNWWRFTTRP